MRRFLPFLIALFLAAALLRIDFYFTLAYLLFGLYLLSRGWSARSLDGVRYERRFARRAFVGDDPTVTVAVSNPGRLPVPWLQVHESLPVELATPPLHQTVLSLGPREQRTFAYHLHCRKRGVYQLGPLVAQAGDLLGLVPIRVAQVAPEPIVVYPRVLPIARLRLPTHSPRVALAARAPLFEDPARVTGVRDYAPGDSPRRIHWTASAASGRLVVKRLQPAIARDSLLCLDLNPEGYPARERGELSELAIEVAASLASYIVRRERLPVGLATHGFDALNRSPETFYLPPRAQAGHLSQLLWVLARLQVGGPPLADVLREVRPRLAWGTTVVAITGAAGSPLLAALGALRQAGYSVALFVVTGRHAPEVDRRAAATLGIDLHQVRLGREAEGWA
jgi:uncharacterized protein (DUF58 family)